MVTISRFSRTFSRGEGLARGLAFLPLQRRRSPAAPRMCASTASMPARDPAMVPLTPRGASSSVPRHPLAQAELPQRALQGGGILEAGEVIEGGDGEHGAAI